MLFAAKEYFLDDLRLGPLPESELDRLAAALVRLEPWRTLGSQAAGLRRYLSRPDPGLHRFLISVSQTAAGVLTVRHPWLLGPFLEMLALLPAFQGQGRGRRLVLWLADQTWPHCRQLWTTASSFNLRARDFYRRLGFVELAVLPDVIRPGFAEILLRLTRPQDWQKQPAASKERSRIR